MWKSWKREDEWELKESERKPKLGGAFGLDGVWAQTAVNPKEEENLFRVLSQISRV